MSRLPASLQVELHDDVAVLRLARERKRNALDDATVLGIGTFFSDSLTACGPWCWTPRGRTSAPAWTFRS